MSSATNAYLRGLLALARSKEHRLGVQTGDGCGAMEIVVIHPTSEKALRAALRMFSHIGFESENLTNLKRTLMSLVERTSTPEILVAASNVLMTLSSEGKMRSVRSAMPQANASQTMKLQLEGTTLHLDTTHLRREKPARTWLGQAKRLQGLVDDATAMRSSQMLSL